MLPAPEMGGLVRTVAQQAKLVFCNGGLRLFLPSSVHGIDEVSVGAWPWEKTGVVTGDRGLRKKDRNNLRPSKPRQ